MQKARRHQPKLTPTACKQTVSGTISLPYSGYFSPFPHGTSSLSVTDIYVALRGGPRRFTPAFPDPALLGRHDRSRDAFRVRGSYPLRPTFPESFHYTLDL